MSQQKPLLVKSGAEYWCLLEKTARLVEKWPTWKTGEPSTAQSATTGSTERQATLTKGVEGAKTLNS